MIKNEFEAFEETIIVRLQPSTKKELQKIVDRYEEIFDLSHAARIAVLQFIKNNK